MKVINYFAVMINPFKSSTLFDRYVNGETEAVYEYIYSLGEDAFSETHFLEIERVMQETFKRVSYNLDIIYTELVKLNYVFWKDKSGENEALNKPADDVASSLDTISRVVNRVGHLPLSLKMFYEIVGSCDFSWNYNESAEIKWEEADPIQIAPIHDVLSQISADDWLEEAHEWINDPDYGYVLIYLAADSLHKDNISGGAPYSIELTKSPSIDSRFLNEPSDTLFINYLRICFKYCGFPGMAGEEHSESFQQFCSVVKPKLKQI